MVESIILGVALSLATTLPLAWKWNLGMRRTTLAVACLGLLTGGLTGIVVSYLQLATSMHLEAVVNWILTLSAALALLLYRFFRDPERTVPVSPYVIVSPADGEVLYVREAKNGILPVSTKRGCHFGLTELTKAPLQIKDAAVIGIGMSFLDVHINRAPIAGRVLMKRHFPGLFGSLRQPAMVFQNERMTTIIQHDTVQVAVVQIASRLVRQIVSFVDEGQRVQLGQRIGVIRFGSQVDLVVPLRTDLKVMVKPGDRVKAGESIVAIHQSQADTVPV